MSSTTLKTKVEGTLPESLSRCRGTQFVTASDYKPVEVAGLCDSSFRLSGACDTAGTKLLWFIITVFHCVSTEPGISHLPPTSAADTVFHPDFNRLHTGANQKALCSVLAYPRYRPPDPQLVPTGLKHKHIARTSIG